MAYSFSWQDVVGKSVIALKNIQPGTTVEDVSNFFWRELGLNVPPENISQSDHLADPWATVILSRECLADWLNRAITAHGLRLNGSIPHAEPSQFGMSKTQATRFKL